MPRNPQPRPTDPKATYTLKRPEPKKPAEFRFTDWAMI